MSVTFIHTSDWHLGKSFGQYGAAGAALHDARFGAVGKIARLATSRQADAVLVAGDAFDSENIGPALLERALREMKSYRGPWVFLPGNHDRITPIGVWTRLEEMKKGAEVDFIVAQEPKVLLVADGQIALLPAPLRYRQECADGTEWFDKSETPPNAVRVGLAHGQVVSAARQGDKTNPIGENRASNSRLDYLALGDRHSALEARKKTWYSGTPEPDEFRGPDAGCALVVTINEPGDSPRVKRARVSKYTWAEENMTVNSAEDIDALNARLKSMSPPERHVVKVTLDGTLSLDETSGLESVLERWRGRFHCLQDDANRVRPAPVDGDFPPLDGYAGMTLELLRKMSGSADDQGEMIPDVSRAQLQEKLEHSASGAELTAQRALRQLRRFCKEEGLE